MLALELAASNGEIETIEDGVLFNITFTLLDYYYVCGLNFPLPTQCFEEFYLSWYYVLTEA